MIVAKYFTENSSDMWGPEFIKLGEPTSEYTTRIEGRPKLLNREFFFLNVSIE